MKCIFRDFKIHTVMEALAFVMLLIMIFVLSACSGGEGGTGAAPAPSSDVSRGQITAFGSIFVNGIEFDTTNTAFTLEDVTGSDSDLRQGMVVTVNGTINADGLTGTADSVDVEEVIKGQVQTTDLTSILTILDQTIQVPSNARFDNVANMAGIAVSDYVEISGYVKDDGIISAIRIERLPSAPSESKLFGTVKNINTTANTFNLGALVISYTGATLSGFDTSPLSDTQFVKVKGSYSAGTLTAGSVENALISADDVAEIEVEGFVTSVIDATNFNINNIAVQTNTNTTYEGGVAGEIFAGMFVEAEGSFVNGVLVAEEIEFDDEIRIEARIESKTLAPDTLVLTGMPGMTVKVDSFTDYATGDFTTLAATNTIRIRAYQASSNTIVARRIDLTSAGDSIAMQGVVTSIPGISIFSILGESIDTTGFPDSAFLKENTVIGRMDFFSDIELNTIVEAKGTLSGSVITWQTVEIID